MKIQPVGTTAHPGRWTSAERKAQIAEIALELITRYGVQSVTLRQIAETAGISPPALYNHFSNLTEILVAVADLIRDRVFEWLDSSNKASAYERLVETMGMLHEQKMNAFPESPVVPLFELLAARREEHMTEEMGKRQLATVQRVVDIIEEGKKQGTIREEVESEVLAWSLLGFGYTKDIALLQGLTSFVTSGTADKILAKLLMNVATAEPSSSPDFASHEPGQ